MKLILLFLMLIPVSSIANSEMRLACENLSKIANENSLQYGTKYVWVLINYATFQTTMR